MYYEKVAVVIATVGLATTLLNASHSNWKAEARESIHYTFSNDKVLDVDNVNGKIDVVGDSGNTIRVEGERVTQGEDQQALERAKREVKLDVNEKDGKAQLYVNGPFRGHHGDGDHEFHYHSDEYNYEVTYNFTIRVPRDTGLQLRTVNGPITAQETRGKFDIQAVNGPVTMTGVAGYGAVNTVNGRVTVSFRENPKQATEFKTVNGAIEATFPPNLAADTRVKTLNGQAYTDFDATALATTAFAKTDQAGERKNGKFVFRTDHASNLRIGGGGPELSFETVNGAISIKKESR